LPEQQKERKIHFDPARKGRGLPARLLTIRAIIKAKTIKVPGCLLISVAVLNHHALNISNGFQCVMMQKDNFVGG
jgi:hypothetical protein